MDLDLYVILTVVGILIGLGAMLWNAARKSASLEIDTKKIRDELHEVTKGLRDEIVRQTTERQEDILKTTVDYKDNLNNHQKQIDALKGDVKGIMARIQVLDTKIQNSEDVHTELKATISRHESRMEHMIKEQQDFLTQWNQRIEDRIEELRKVVERRFNGCRDNEDTRG